MNYSEAIQVPLISVEDSIELKKNKLLIDLRPFSRAQYPVFGVPDSEPNKYANFLDCHVKNSYYMVDTVSLLEISARNNDSAAYEKELEKLQRISQV